MSAASHRQILSNLYGLMMEINSHRSDDEVLEHLSANPSARIDRHLLRIKQLNGKLKAEANKHRFASALEQIRILKEKGVEGFRNLVEPQQQSQLIPLFRRFEELTSQDRADILEDEELLNLIERLNKGIDNKTDE